MADEIARDRAPLRPRLGRNDRQEAERVRHSLMRLGRSSHLERQAGLLDPPVGLPAAHDDGPDALEQARAAIADMSDDQRRVIVLPRPLNRAGTCARVHPRVGTRLPPRTFVLGRHSAANATLSHRPGYHGGGSSDACSRYHAPM
jgi:hypothetical protein